MGSVMALGARLLVQKVSAVGFRGVYLEDHPMTCNYLVTMIKEVPKTWGCGTTSKWPFYGL